MFGPQEVTVLLLAGVVGAWSSVLRYPPGTTPFQNAEQNHTGVKDTNVENTLFKKDGRHQGTLNNY